MNHDKTVIINGQKYDAATGLPIVKPMPQPKSTLSTAVVTNKNRIQSFAQKTQSLSIRAAKKTASNISTPIRKIGRTMDIARSKSISRFAPQTSAIKSTTKHTGKNKQMDIGPIKHPLAAKVNNSRSLIKNQLNKSATKSSKTIKEEAIAEALEKPLEKPAKIGFFKRHTKFINIFSISMVLLIVAGYFTYLSMPSLSVRIASAQAGINATYPEYRPDGYSVNGPVSYSNGQVTINFHANTGKKEFVIKQSRSSWDSSAVKNKVDKDSKGEFVTTEEHGLTIYTYNGNATWVNGGILYAITGDAPLSGEQIRRIATSL